MLGNSRRRAWGRFPSLPLGLFFMACSLGSYSPAVALTEFGSNPEFGDGNYNTGRNNTRTDKTPGTNKNPGDWGPRAESELTESTEQISNQEAAAAAAMQASAQKANCNGSTCKSAADIARLAYATSKAVEATANSRLFHAEESRKAMLANLGSGRYSAQEAASVRALLRVNSDPLERDIQGLPPPTHDIARGLVTNQREQRMLEGKRSQYARVSADAKDISRKLGGIARRAEAMQARAALPGSARKPNQGFEENSFLKDSSAITGGFERKLSGRSTEKVLPPLENFGLLPELGTLGMSPKGSNPGTGSLSQPLETGEKKLSSEGIEVIAGMISELNFDLNKKLPTDYSAGPSGMDNKAIAGLNMPDGVEETSLLGGVLRAANQSHLESAARTEGGTIALGNGRAPASSSGVSADLNFLGSEKDLFKRVNDQMRRRAGKEF